jgi:hypothetical protein
MRAPARGPELIAIVPPGLSGRALRLCPSAAEPLRVEIAGQMGRMRRGVALRIPRREAGRLEADPLISSRLVLAPAGSERIRRLGEAVPPAPPRPPRPPIPLPPAAVPREAALDARSFFRPRRGRSLPPAGSALWIPESLVAAFLDMLSREPPPAWSAIRVAPAAGGIVAEGELPSRRRLAAAGLALAVPLERRTLADGSLLLADARVDVSPLAGSVVPPGRDLLAIARDGEARLEAIGKPAEAASLLEHCSARLPYAGPAREPPAPAAEADPRSARAARAVARSLRGQGEDDSPLRKAIEDAFEERGAAGALRGAPVAPGGEERGWLRRFFPRVLPESVRRRLDARARARVRDLDERSRIIARQRDALTLLQKSLSGPGWRAAIPLALPLRPPGEKEPGSRWLNVEASLGGEGPEFSLGAAARKAALGVVGVGPEIYRQFQALYRRAAEKLLGLGDHRRAAHVHSYLLGEHERAAAILEQGGMPLEAATVHYHLAGNARKAAVALERGGLDEEAARIWMDLGRWRAAARAWGRARNDAQAIAAWRRVAIDLANEGRALEAADVLEGELGEPRAAAALLEEHAIALGPASLEALERALRARLQGGEEARARDLFERAAAAFAGASLGSPSRSALKLLARFAARAAAWSAEAPLSRVVSRAAARAAWVSTAKACAKMRARASILLRSETDALLLAAARGFTGAGGDPWLLPDVERWLAAALAPGARGGGTAIAAESFVAGRPASFLAIGGAALAGDEEGSIAVLDAGGRVIGRLDTGSSRPVTALQASRTDVYSAADAEVHHFAWEGGRAETRAPARPLQIERTLPGAVEAIHLLPDGLLRVTARRAHLLHPVHLGVISLVHDAGEHSIAASAANRRFAALLISLGREEPDEEARFEVLVFQRRPRGARADLRLIERFPADVASPRRLAFLGPDGDDLVLIGDESLLAVPSRRNDARRFALEASSAEGRAPAARVASTPRHDALLIAYGDGSVELLRLSTGERSALLDAPEGMLDPLVGFACEAAEGPRGPRRADQRWTAWLLHRSGLLRRASPPAPRSG